MFGRYAASAAPFAGTIKPIIYLVMSEAGNFQSSQNNTMQALTGS